MSERDDIRASLNEIESVRGHLMQREEDERARARAREREREREIDRAPRAAAPRRNRTVHWRTCGVV